MLYLSIDPGIAHLGISVIDNTNEFKVLETVLVKNTRKFTDEEKIIEIAYGPRVVKVLAIVDSINQLLDKYKAIEIIILEAPFYSALTPVSYGALLEVISAIKYKIIIPRDLPFKLIEPLLVKKLFTNKGMASKEAMKQFLIQKKENGNIVLETEIDTLSEHEIDAIAIGFVYHLSLLNPPIPA